MKQVPVMTSAELREMWSLLTLDDDRLLELVKRPGDDRDKPMFLRGNAVAGAFFSYARFATGFGREFRG